VVKAWSLGNGRQVGLAEVDMTQFIGKSDGKIRVQMLKSELNNCVIECEFKVQETLDPRNEDDSGDEDTKTGDTTPTKDSPPKKQSTLTASAVVATDTSNSAHSEDESARLR
jgi:hypothetical protein